MKSFEFEVNTPGAKYTPWTDGYAVGFRCEHRNGTVEYVYLNPSQEEEGDLSLEPLLTPRTEKPTKRTYLTALVTNRREFTASCAKHSAYSRDACYAPQVYAGLCR